MLSNNHNVDEDAKAPHIALLIVVAQKYFRRRIFRCTAFPLETLPTNNGSEPPIYDFDDPFPVSFVHEKILCLEIAMRYLFFMCIMKCF